MLTFKFATFTSPSEIFTQVNGINTLGQIIGFYEFVGGEIHSFINTSGAFVDLPYSSSTFEIKPLGINASEVVVGAYVTNDDVTHAFLHNSQGYLVVDDPTAGSSGFTEFAGINDSGLIVGNSGDGSTDHIFLYNSNSGKFTPLSNPNQNVIEILAHGMNSHGQIVGEYYDGAYHGFIYTNGSYQTLDAPNASAATGGTQASGINASGQVVGNYFDADGGIHGFFWDRGTFQTIDEPLAILEDGGTVPTGINDQGEIVGVYFDDTGRHGFTASYRTVPKVEIQQVNGSSIDLASAENTDGGDFYFRIHVTGSFSQPFVVTLLPNAPSADPLLTDGTDAHFGADWVLDSGSVGFDPSDFTGQVGVPNADGSVLNADGSIDHLVKVHVNQDAAGEDASIRYFDLGIDDSASYSTDPQTSAATGTIYGPTYSPVKAVVFGLDEGTNLSRMLERDFQAAVDRFVAAVGPGQLKTINIDVDFVTFASPQPGHGATLAETTRDTLVTKPATVYKSLSPSADIVGIDSVAIPGLLLGYRNGETASGVVDWHIRLDQTVLHDIWYKGTDSSAFATTILTHELLHAAGFGQGDSLDIPEPAWDTHIADDLLKYYVLGQDKILLTGTNAIDGGNHLDKPGDLMNPSISGDIAISATDISILRDFGYASSASIQGNGQHASTSFYQASANFTLASDGHGNVIANSAFTPTTTISGIEFLRFPDKTIFVESADNANIARLYSAALGRAPDLTGQSGWEDIYANNVSAAAKANGVYFALAQTNDGFGTSIAGGFTQSVEFQSKYGNLNDAGFVTQLYVNVLSRAPAASELGAWLDLMHNHAFTPEMVLVGFAESPENIAKTAGDWLVQI